MKKRLFVGIILFALTLAMSAPAIASNQSSTDTPVPMARGQLTISDPCTGEQWVWALSTSDILLVNGRSGYGNSAETIQNSEVTIELGEYLTQTMTNPIDAEKVLYEDITLTAGLRYSTDAKNNTVSIYRAYGSAPDKGLYYAISKLFYYSNPPVFDPVVQAPTGTSWSYVTDSTPGNYYDSLPPYALLDCRITVAGMEYAYRDVSVLCELTGLY